MTILFKYDFKNLYTKNEIPNGAEIHLYYPISFEVDNEGNEGNTFSNCETDSCNV